MTLTRSDRDYLATHPWINFEIDLRDFTPKMWMMIGEVFSKCDHIAGVPIPPRVAQELHTIYLAKGVLASAAIEGNTLTEDEVIAQIDGKLEVPESQEYLKTETQNLVDAANMVINEMINGHDLMLTPERIMEFHKMVLKNLPLEDGLTPGQFRTSGVMVGNVYKGVHARDAEYLVNRLCEWLDQMQRECEPQYLRPLQVVQAIVAHLYIAWIHPFLNGNGRTARLVEFQLLMRAGFPSPACHLLSNHYNRTRSRYYEVLRQVSARRPYSIMPFIDYALKGFVDELQQQLATIRESQSGIVWKSFVYEIFHDRVGPVQARQREMLLSLPADTFTPTADIRHLTPSLAEQYANRQHKTISRDVGVLTHLKLIEVTRQGIRPRTELIEGFLPLRKK